MSSQPALFDLTLSELPVVIDEHVRWGDMDAFGHMNNAVFFRLFEAARMAYFEQLGFSTPDDNDGLGPILAHTECYFRRPLFYPQSLKVGARISELKEDSLTMQYGLFLANEDATLAACGTGRIVCFNYRESARGPVPDTVVNRIHTLENNALK